jgi:hypothetical protein
MLLIPPYLQVLEKRGKINKNDKQFIIYKNKHSSLLLPPHQLRIKILIELTHVINAFKHESLTSIRQSNNN